MPNGGLIADVTWGRGVFWKKIQNGQPNLFNGATYTIIGSDIEQKADVKADFRCLPYRDETFDCVVLDPPWRVFSPASDKSFIEKQSDFNQRYKMPSLSSDSIINLYRSGIKEAKRIARSAGILIIKCQDAVMDNGKRWVSFEVLEMANENSLIPIDRMTQVAASGIALWLSPNQKNQRHFRARESFYWVFRKV